MPQLPCPPGGYFCDENGNKIQWYPGFQAEVGGFYEFINGKPVGTRAFAPGESWEQFWDVTAGPVRWSGDDRRHGSSKKDAKEAKTKEYGEMGPKNGESRQGFGNTAARHIGTGAGPSVGLVSRPPMGVGTFGPGMQGSPVFETAMGPQIGGGFIAWTPRMMKAGQMGIQQLPFGPVPGSRPGGFGPSMGINPAWGPVFGGAMNGGRY
jgi:hypothetical protein